MQVMSTPMEIIAGSMYSPKVMPPSIVPGKTALNSTIMNTG